MRALAIGQEFTFPHSLAGVPGCHSPPWIGTPKGPFFLVLYRYLPMKIQLTMDELLRAAGSMVESHPSMKRRDPVERELLIRLGDEQALRERKDGAPNRKAGERPVRPNRKMVW